MRVCSLLGVRLLRWVSGHEFGDILQILHDGHRAGELSHVDALPLRVIDHGRKEGVGEGQDVTQAVLTLRLLHGALKRGEASNDGPLGPWLPVLLPETRLNLTQHGQVLDRLRS